MNFCPQCGTKIVVSWNVCPNCNYILIEELRKFNKMKYRGIYILFSLGMIGFLLIYLGWYSIYVYIIIGILMFILVFGLGFYYVKRVYKVLKEREYN